MSKKDLQNVLCSLTKGVQKLIPVEDLEGLRSTKEFQRTFSQQKIRKMAIEDVNKKILFSSVCLETALCFRFFASVRPFWGPMSMEVL